jgi:hypothetical protein
MNIRFLSQENMLHHCCKDHLVENQKTNNFVENMEFLITSNAGGKCSYHWA